MSAGIALYSIMFILLYTFVYGEYPPIIHQLFGYPGPPPPEAANWFSFGLSPSRSFIVFCFPFGAPPSVHRGVRRPKVAAIFLLAWSRLLVFICVALHTLQVGIVVDNFFSYKVFFPVFERKHVLKIG